MNKLDQKKKTIFLLATYFIILLTPKLKKKQNNVTYNSNYQITEDNQFATYNNYNIYIYDKENISKIDNNNPNNIYIIDHRCEENPNIRIYNSYRIRDRNEMFEILKILLEYENRYPTKWHRTIDTMENEWIAHNIGYLLGVETIRAKEVDFDNDDEENYQNLLTIIDTILNYDYSQKESDKMIKKLSK